MRYIFPVTTTTQSEPRTVRIETEAVYAALSAGALGAVLGAVATWGTALAFWGWPSAGGFAAIVAGAVAIAAAATAYSRSGALPGQEWRRGLRSGRAVVNVVSVTIAHAALAALATAVVYLVLGLGFVGMVLRPFEGAVLGAVSTGLAAYLVYLSASRISTQRLSSLLLSFVALGTLTAMATSPDPDWWRFHFSELGTFAAFSSVVFNGTLIAAGLLVTTFAAYVQSDLSALVTTGRLTSRRSRSVVPALLVVMGVMLACVGIVPVNLNEPIHNLAASGMALMFFGLLGSSPWLLRGMPRAFFLSTAAIGAAFVAAVVLFVVGFFGLTAFEIAVFALIFGWIAIFIRFLGVTGQKE
ncbi:MAG: hypothetical protein BGO95_00760 [Micrococcales bacterium 73-13]|nr:MAG: hypothetical protein BGO95_00760 [Micrococcales bacterium 73-13]